MTTLPITPNAELARQVKATLEPYLGDYLDGTTVKGKAWLAVHASSALVSEGLNPAWTVRGLEAVFATYPSPVFQASYEMTDRGMKGAIYYEIVLKSWQGSSSPAYEALLSEFPLMTTRLAKAPRFVPAFGEVVETLTTWVPLIR